MAWRFTDDPAAYADQVWDLLARNPAEQTVALTVAASARAGHRWSEEPMLFGWYDDGEVRGAVSFTPPYELLLAVVPDDTVVALAEGLRARGVAVPGVNGKESTVDRFVAAWSPARSSVAFRMRLYRLGTLQPPVPPPDGTARPADEDDVPLAIRWLEAFEEDAGVHRTNVEPLARDRVGDGRLWLWEHDGEAVSMAARTAPAAGVSRIAPVYTPAEHRRRGYGAAATAACTADAVERGADDVVLFTDLANPTSNSIYQQIGFAPVGDYRVVRFGG
jgi:predicted GNAT family acetyltransferase